MSFDLKLKNNWLNDRIRMKKHLFNKCIRWQTRLHVEQIEKSSLSHLNAPCGYTFQVFYRVLSNDLIRVIFDILDENFQIISATLYPLSIYKCMISTTFYWERTVTEIYDENNPISDIIVLSLDKNLQCRHIVPRKHVNKCCVVFSASFFDAVVSFPNLNSLSLATWSMAEKRNFE